MTTKRHMTSESIPLTTTTTTEFIPPTSTSPMLSSLTPTPSPSPSRWLTPEFGIYYVILGYCLYFGTQLVANISEKLNTGEISSRGLQKGWIGDRHIDLRDQQYAFFRDNLALLTGAAIIFLLISHGVRRINSSLRFRMTFYFIIALGFIIFLNGTSSIFMMTIVTFNYLVTSFIITSKASVVFTWVYACFILLVNERYRGYRWSELMGPTWSTWDEYHGLFPWHILFNLVILRMISFNMDYHWFSTARSLTDPSGIIISFEKHTVKCHECRIRGERDACTWWREKAHRTKEEYNYMYYIAYLFYPPLHLAGPTTTYNSFISHITSSQKTYTHRDLIMYIIRLLFAIMIMEIVLHYLYVFVITGSDLYKTLTPTEVSMISYWTLHTMWLKFLILWRFFRTWALLDGVEAPENMNRCMSNNYSVEGFWRSWHRSFNRWLVRYIYVPLGGRGPSTSPLKSVQDGRSSGGLARLMRRIVNTFITFTFVAFWHDRTMQLLAWGWLIALIFVPELTASSIANLKRFKSMRESWYWRHIRASGAALNIFLMMLINLIGYSVGVSGTTTILATLFTPGNGSLLCLIFAVFFSAAQIMFEVRQQEIRTALAQGKAANIEY